jgi:hypothetical protein
VLQTAEECEAAEGVSAVHAALLGVKDGNGRERHDGDERGDGEIAFVHVQFSFVRTQQWLRRAWAIVEAV